MNRLSHAAALLLGTLVAGCSALPTGGAMPGASDSLERARSVAPLNRQQLGVLWNQYASFSLEHTWVLSTAGNAIVGTSPLQNRLAVFDPASGAVTAFAPASAGGITVAEPLTAIAGKDGFVYFVSFQGSPALGRFTMATPPVFSYCTLPAAPTGALAQDPASGALYVADQAGYVDTITWNSGPCSVSATRFQDPEPGGYPFALVVGWQGHVFLGDVSGHIVEISNGTLVHDYAIANAGAVPKNTAYDLTALLYDAKDDQIWFSTPRNVQIGRLTPNGDIAYFYVAYGYNVGYGTSPLSMVLGPDGKIWAAVGSDKVWTIEPNAVTGTMATALTPPNASVGANFTGITTGPDRQVYVSDVNSDRVYAYNYLLITTNVQQVTLQKGASATVTVSESNYSGKLTATSSAPSIVSCTIVPSSGKYRLSLHWKATGTSKIGIVDSFGNSAFLPVVAK